MVEIQITAETNLTQIDDIIKNLDDKTELLDEMGNAVEDLVHQHLLDYASTHHNSANKLNAVPTGFLTEAADNITGSVEGDEYIIEFNTPGISRAFHPITITAHNSKWLTIPTSSESYGRSLTELIANGWKTFKPLNHDVIMGSTGNEDPICLYALKKTVTIPQDRSMLPTDDELDKAALDAVLSVISPS